MIYLPMSVSIALCHILLSLILDEQMNGNGLVVNVHVITKIILSVGRKEETLI